MQIASKRYPKTHGERKQNAGAKGVRSKRRNLPTAYDNAGKRGDQRSWKEQRKNQFREGLDEEDRNFLIQEIVGLLSPGLGVAKSGMKRSMNMAKHQLATRGKKIKHNVAIQTGKAKPGSHWSK